MLSAQILFKGVTALCCLKIFQLLDLAYRILLAMVCFKGRLQQMNTGADYKAYLVTMTSNTKVQFVLFETTLSAEPFMKRWNEYTRPSKSDKDVTMQQSEKKDMFSYIAQHRFESGELHFFFAKEGRPSRIPREKIKITQVGGYSVLQAERLDQRVVGESKVFIFLADANTDLSVFKELTVNNQLNIYQEYYENCRYAYILEYFVKNNKVAGFLEELKQYTTIDTGIYKECTLVKNTEPKKVGSDYVWSK